MRAGHLRGVRAGDLRGVTDIHSLSQSGLLSLHALSGDC